MTFKERYLLPHLEILSVFVFLCVCQCMMVLRKVYSKMGVNSIVSFGFPHWAEPK